MEIRGFKKDWSEITLKIRRKSVTSATTHYRESGINLGEDYTWS